MTISTAYSLTKQFYEWEQMGRGWLKAECPVELEPPFHPFFGHSVEGGAIIDDGKRPHWLTGLFGTVQPTHREQSFFSPNITAFPYTDDSLLSIVTVQLPKQGKFSAERMEQLLIMLSYRKSPISFELAATAETVTIQLVCREADADFLAGQSKAFFPECGIIKSDTDMLLEVLEKELPIALVDFALQEEFMRPLAGLSEPDPFVPLFGAFNQLKGDEVIMFQVLFSGTHNPWAESILTAVTDYSGKQSFFADAPEMPQVARDKVSRPLFGIAIRLIACAETAEEASQLLYQSAIALMHASTSPYNALIPLSDERYSVLERLEDMLQRKSRRLGMIVNSRELATFVHFPQTALSPRKLLHSHRNTKLAPALLNDPSYVIGYNTHQGVEQLVGLPVEQRLRHMHIIGATGTGKSTFLHSLIMQDIINGHGCCVLDPHGDLLDQVLSHIPEDRVRDVVYINPSDSQYPIGFNILSAHSEIEKELLASDLVAVFRRFSTSWGDQMNSVFANAIMAMVYNARQFHLGDLRRFLIEPAFRSQVLSTITDPDIGYYWQHEFPIVKSTSIGPILTRLDTFLRPKIIRNMVCQTKSLNVQALMDGQKIILVKLSLGLMGAENSYVLGALLVSKLQQIAMARQAQLAKERVPFFCYIDEFHHFITPSMEEILSGTRKYGLGLVLAHQEMQQVAKYDDIAASLLSNTGTRICFRLGDADSKRLQEGFSSFGADDLQNLNIGEAIARINRADNDFTVDNIPYEGAETHCTDAIIDYCRDKYSVPVVQTTQETASSSVIEEKNVYQQTEKLIEPTTEQIREHRYLQTFIKKMAEEYGYKGNVEVPTPDGKGYIDVVLEKDSQRMAIEISVTTGPEWELHNIEKCLAAGYNNIVVCSADAAKRKCIDQHIAISLSEQEQQKVRVISPEEIASLFNTTGDTKPTTTIMKGYRVKVQYENNDGKANDILKSIIANAKKP